MVERLSPLEASFLYLEEAATPCTCAGCSCSRPRPADWMR